jgi:hypothetical protein
VDVVGEPQADGVSARPGRKVPQNDARDARPLAFLLVDVHDPADHLGVEPGAGDVLADLVDQQDVQSVEGQRGVVLPGLGEQLRLALEHGRGRHRFQAAHRVGLVFQNGDAASDGQFPEQDPRDRLDGLDIADPHRELVHDLGPGDPAQAHDRHLEQAGLDLADELRVLLDAVDDEDVIRFDRRAVGIDRAPLGFADLHGVHAVVDRRCQGFRGLAEMPEDLDLPRSRAAAVAAHGRQDERPAAPGLGGLDNGTQRLRHAAHAAAAGRDQHGLPGPDRREQARALQFHLDAGRDIDRRPRLEILLQNMKLRIIHRLSNLLPINASASAWAARGTIPARLR